MIKIYDLLYQFGLTVNYTGFFYPAYAIKLCVECPVQLLLVRRWVYPATANRYKISNEAVERNIWAIGCIIWSSLLEHMEDTRLTHKASAQNAEEIIAISGNPSFPPSFGVVAYGIVSDMPKVAFMMIGAER